MEKMIEKIIEEVENCKKKKKQTRSISKTIESVGRR